MKRLVLVGGGHSHVEVLRQFGVRQDTRAALTLVSPVRYTSYSGMLPGLVAGHYRYHDCHLDLEYLAKLAGARFIQGQARNMDTRKRQLILADGNAIDYDLLALDVGSTSAPPVQPGAADSTIAVKPVEGFLRAWNELIERAPTGQVRKILVAGGGAAGVELALAMQHRLHRLPGSGAVALAIVTDNDRLLPGHNAGTRGAFSRILSERGIDVHVNCRLLRTESSTAITADGAHIPADAVIRATGAYAPPWLRDTPLKLDAAGFIATDECLRSLSHPDIFAAGDCATMAGLVYPKSGVYAVRQGPILAHNLRHALGTGPLVKYRPQPRALALIGTGDQSAVASYGNLTLRGAWVWRWKDRIDRGFMARYAAPN